MSLTSGQIEELFGVLGEKVRLRLACCLLTSPEGWCVTDLVRALEVPQPNVSRHLKLMKAAGLVEQERRGRQVFYRLRGAQHPFLQRLRCCVETVCCCPDIQQDLNRLQSQQGPREKAKSSARARTRVVRRTRKGGQTS